MRSLMVPAALLLLVPLACNKHVFEVTERMCTPEERQIVEVDVGGPIDILFVVDDSGSMAEEQQALADGFYRESCPFLTDDVPFVPDEEKNPTDERLAELAALCGFIQILGAFERDFRVGVVTTTVDECDNRYGQAPAGWGRRPRRGCLMHADNDDTVFEPADDRLHDRFREALAKVGTYGSGFERGLDAAKIFLDPGAARAPGCDDDLSSFLRESADLAVVILTDEDDCSRDGPLPEGADELPDETAFRSCDLEPAAPIADGEADLRASDCYEPNAALADVEHYAAWLRAQKRPGTDVRVAVIGGEVNGEPGGCRPGPNGSPEGGCFETGGRSIDPTLCGPDARPGEPACCLADGAYRYAQLADALGGLYASGSICAPFAQTLMETARFLGRTDGVRLSEPPAVPGAVRVRVTRANGDEDVLLPTEPDSGETGWFFESPTLITFVGTGAPQPGDTVDVAVLVDRPRDTCRSPADDAAE